MVLERLSNQVDRRVGLSVIDKLDECGKARNEDRLGGIGRTENF